jgi:hypothetical protein
MEFITDVWVDESPRDMPALELALLRQGVQRRDATQERCSHCHRTPLAGERIYLSAAGPVLCALCCPQGEDRLLRSQRVRGAVVGPGIRVLTRRAA